MKSVIQPYDVNLGSFITEDVLKCWIEYWKKVGQKPDVIIRKQRFIFEPSEEEKIHYQATVLKWVDHRCLHCSLLSFCFRDFMLIVKGMECEHFLHWRFLRTISWNKNHKYNPELRTSGLIKFIDKEQWLDEERMMR